MMNGFHHLGNGASSQLRTKTIPKKIAKSIVGNSTREVVSYSEYGTEGVFARVSLRAGSAAARAC